MGTVDSCAQNTGKQIATGQYDAADDVADPVIHQFVPHLALSPPRPPYRDSQVNLFALARRMSSRRNARLDIRVPAGWLKKCLAPQTEFDGSKAC